MLILRTCMAHKLQAGRYVIKQIAHTYSRSMQASFFATLDYMTTTHHNIGPGNLFTSRFNTNHQAKESKFRNSGNTGKSLAAKAQRMQTIQIINIANLTGGVTCAGNL